MGFLTPDAPKTNIKSQTPPPSAPTRAEPSIALAGLRAGGRPGAGSTTQRAATSLTSGGVLGSTPGSKRKRTLIGGSA